MTTKFGFAHGIGGAILVKKDTKIENSNFLGQLIFVDMFPYFKLNNHWTQMCLHYVNVWLSNTIPDQEFLDLLVKLPILTMPYNSQIITFAICLSSR